MTKLFDDKYKTKSSRLSERDYSHPGSYFITICTNGRKSNFGEVIDGDIQLNEIGNIVQYIWSEIPRYFENVALNICMIMPNHVHGIITINEDFRTNECNVAETSIHSTSPKHAINQNIGHAINQNIGHAINRVSTNINKNIGGITGNKNTMLNKNSLSYIIRWLKGKTSFLIKKYNPTFKRQPNYYEHVVRNERDLERIRTYIINNPHKRKNDEYYT